MCVWIFVGCRPGMKSLKNFSDHGSFEDMEQSIFFKGSQSKSSTQRHKKFTLHAEDFSMRNPGSTKITHGAFLYYKETVSRFRNRIRIGRHYITPVPTGLHLHVSTHPQLAMKAAAMHAATRIRFCGMLFSKHLLQGFLDGSLDQTFLGWDDRMKVIFNLWMLVWVKH